MEIENASVWYLNAGVYEIDPWGQFHNTKRRRFKRQIMAFTRQKWHLTFMKFHKTVLAFKTPKCGVCITNIGV